jgi:RNA polymerase-binding protein DksA
MAGNDKAKATRVGIVKAAATETSAGQADVPAQAAEPTVAKASPRKAAAAKPPAEVLPEVVWTSDELAEIRAELHSQARELSTEIVEADRSWSERQRDSGDSAGDDQADAGSKTFEREHELSLAANSRDLLSQVERALARLDAGTYGRCENCGNPISKPRLQAFPRATLCLECKQREERR